MSCILKMCLNSVTISYYPFSDFYMYFVLIDITGIHMQSMEFSVLIAVFRSLNGVQRKIYLNIIGV